MTEKSEQKTYVTNSPKTPVASPEQAPRKTDKYILSVDDLRLIGYSLTEEENPFQNQDIFDIQNWYITGKGELSSYAFEVLGWIQLDTTIVLDPRKYKKELLISKQ